MSFDWQTEEDGDWDDFESLPSESTEKEPPGKRRWLGWLILLGLVSGAVVVAGWSINQRVQTATKRVEEEILASYAVVDQAVARQDGDLFRSVLSGKDDDWSNAMMQMVVNGEFSNRQSLDLTTLPVSETIAPTIVVSPDLQEAEVTTAVAYAIEVGNGLTETVELEQTAVFRKGPNRWLLSPPTLSFWGDTRQIQGQFVNLFYPERDKEIAQDLLFSLDAKIGQLCAQLSDVDCPANYQVVVELATSPETFQHAGFRSSYLSLQAESDGHLILPTPTLVGLPVDQMSENALFRGYGQVVVRAILTELWGSLCCNANAQTIAVTGMLHSAVLDDALRQLGLKAWPGEAGTAVPLSEYGELYENGVPMLFAGINDWYESDVEAFEMPDKRIEILVEFLQQELELSRPEIIAGINQFFTGQTFGGWLLTEFNSNLSANELANAWQGFVYNRTSIAQEVPPVPFPEQDIQLLCQIGDEERMALYRHDIVENSTTLEQPLNRFADKMVALPNDDGLAVWENEGEESSTQMFLWVDGQKIEISWDAGENAPGPIPLHVELTNQTLILAPAQYEQMTYGLLDVFRCLDDDCQLDSLVGYPYWSPDQTHMILLSSSSYLPHEALAYGRLVLADSSGEEIRTFAFGSSPFWLDDQTFGFISDEDGSPRQLIVSGKVDEATRDYEVLLTAEALTAVLDEGSQQTIDFVAPNPAQPNKLIIVTTVVEENERNIFIYDLTTEEITFVQTIPVGSTGDYSYRFSPDGRYLLLQQFTLAENGVPLMPYNALHLIDLENGIHIEKKLISQITNPVYWISDFSQDGDWLLVSDYHMLYLRHLNTGYERLLFPGTGVCKTAVFVNKMN